MKKHAWSFVLILIMLASQGAPAQEQAIKAKNLPKAVLSAFEKEYPNAKILGCSKEKEHGKIIFEIESIDGKIHRDLSYDGDGNNLEIEEEMSFEALPAAVQSAFRKDYPGGKVLRTEKVAQGETVKYEMVVKDGKKKREIIYDGNGGKAK